MVIDLILPVLARYRSYVKEISAPVTADSVQDVGIFELPREVGKAVKKGCKCTERTYGRLALG